MVEEIPQEQSGLMLAFTKVVKAMNDVKMHFGETDLDLEGLEEAAAICQAQLEAVDAELGQMAAGTRDEDGRYIYKELMAAEKMIQRQIGEIQTDQRITGEVRVVLEQMLSGLLNEQSRILTLFSPSMRN